MKLPIRYLVEYFKNEVAMVCDSANETICQRLDTPDAEFIVEAVNAHATLTDRVKELETFAEIVCDVLNSSSGLTKDDETALLRLIESARELLPKKPKDVV